MAKPGRPSTASLVTVPRLARDRLSVPAHLDETEAAEWRAIVDSLPADYFRPGDVPLLAEFCIASAASKWCNTTLKAEGFVIDDGRRQWAHPAVAIQQMQRAAMAQMAVKLRLCPSSRYTEKSAQTKSTAAAGKRPWEAQQSAP